MASDWGYFKRYTYGTGVDFINHLVDSGVTIRYHLTAIDDGEMWFGKVLHGFEIGNELLIGICEDSEFNPTNEITSVHYYKLSDIDEISVCEKDNEE